MRVSVGHLGAPATFVLGEDASLPAPRAPDDGALVFGNLLVRAVDPELYSESFQLDSDTFAKQGQRDHSHGSQKPDRG